MTFAVKSFCITFLFLLLAQAAGIYFAEILQANTRQYFSIEHTEIHLLAGDLASGGEIQSVLSLPDALHLPDALLSPFPSFQFGIIVFLACSLFVIFNISLPVTYKERPLLRTNSYFHTLFLSVILINAP